MICFVYYNAAYWYPAGTNLVSGIQLVSSWYPVSSWYLVGIQLVSSWYPVGI